jgi:signal transduction histidine kinase
LSPISIKTTLFYVFSFIVGSLLLLLFTAYIFDASLKSKDKDILDGKLKEYSLLLEKEGVSNLKKRILSENVLDDKHFLIRYRSDSGKTLFLHIPDSIDNDGLVKAIDVVENSLEKESYKVQWLEISKAGYGDDIEIISKKLQNGDVLQIGKDTEDREEFLWKLIYSFLIGLIPLMFISFIIGYLFSKNMLRPIRWLTDTIKKIRSGHSSSRVPLVGNRDELDNLGTLFNEMQDENEKLLQGMKETLDNVAHDLRTPLMRIQNSIHLALQDGNSENINTTSHNALIECQETSETILKMLNTIMDISEVETGTISLNKEDLLLHELLESVLNIYDFIAEERSIQVICKITSNLIIKGDKGRLLQAFANIVDNAIKYSPDGSTIILRGFRSNQNTVFEIIDEGVGISLDDIPRVWDRLYRGDKSRSTQGLGLGLSFVKAIIDAHQAHIEVENNMKQGCTFRIHFP